MGKIFAYDSKLMTALGAVADVFIINLLFLLCCCPIVTIGAARTALHTVTGAWAKKESAGAKKFLRAFKDNFWPATWVWLTMLAVGLILTADFYMLANSTFERKTVMMYIVGVPAALYLFSLSRVFEVVSWFKCSYMQYLRNSLLIALAHPIGTILHIVLLALPVALFFLAPYAFTVLGLLWLFAYFPLEGLFDAALSKKTYERLVKQATGEAPEVEEKMEELPAETNDEENNTDA